MWAAYNLIVILQSEKTREIFLKDESTVTQKLTMEGDPAKTTVDLRCARRCSARAGTGAEISKSYVKELLTHYTRKSEEPHTAELGNRRRTPINY